MIYTSKIRKYCIQLRIHNYKEVVQRLGTGQFVRGPGKSDFTLLLAHNKTILAPFRTKTQHY
jgi:hypothetical protein